jgi:RNA polymerase sigma-70 factor (ECF subfamily)
MSTANATVSKPLCLQLKPDQEVQLLRLARQGNDAASEKLFLNYVQGSKSITNFLKRALKSPEDREEMMHEIFMRLITGQNEFRGDARLSTYIYQVARVTLLQKFRRENTLKRGRVYRILSTPVEVPAGRETSPDFIYTLKEVREILSELIEKLPQAYRDAMRLRILEDCTYEEIARKMGLPLPTVSTKIHKGKKLLAESLRGVPDFLLSYLH